MQLQTLSATPTLTKRNIFAQADAHPLVLNMLLLKEFGPEYLGWEIETVLDEIRLTWGTSISDVNKQKVEAIRSIYIADEVLQEWEQFEAVTNGLMGVAPRMDISQRPSPGRCLVALDIICNIRDTKLITPEIYKYCAAVLMDFGVAYGPGKLEPANQYLTHNEPELSKIVQMVKQQVIPSTNDSVLVGTQVMKSLSIKDFGTEMDQLMRSQMKQLGV